MNGEKEAKRLWYRHPAPRGGGSGESPAPGDTKILRERGGTEGVPGVEGASERNLIYIWQSFQAECSAIYHIFCGDSIIDFFDFIGKIT